MSNDVSVYGTCKYEGSIEQIGTILKQWEINDLLLAPEEGKFTLDGEYRNHYSGPQGPIEEEYLFACLRQISTAITVASAEFRCYGQECDSTYDIIYANGQFLIVPLELQPTLQALDDPAVRDHYGLDYCVSIP